MVTVKERLRELMEIYGIKQQDIINKTGISSSCISSYLSGKREPKSDKIYVIAEAFGVNPVWLTGFEAPMKSTTNTIKEMAEQDAEMTSDPLWSSLYELFQSLSDADKQEVVNFIKFKANK